MKKIKISNKWMKHKFMCSKDYIENVCHGCCSGTERALLFLSPNELSKFSEIKNPFVKDCPYVDEKGLCYWDKNNKPKIFSCVIYPFTLNESDTFVLSHGAIAMKCHGKGKPVYESNQRALPLLFGEAEANRIVEHLKTTDEDFYANIEDNMYYSLKYLNYLKKLSK